MCNYEYGTTSSEEQYGNSLEIREAILALNGDIEEDVKEIVLEIVSYILKLAGKGDNLEENKQKAMEVIENGKAYNKFKELVQKQDGDIQYLEDIPKAKYIVEVNAEEKGYITNLNARTCRRGSNRLGCSEE